MFARPCLRPGAARLRGDLDQFGVVEPIVPVGLRQQLAAMRLRYAEAGRQIQLAGARGAGKEIGDYLAVFLWHHRAGGIQQHAANVERGPERIEHLALQAGQRGDVFGLACQLDVRMPTNHAGRRTGRVEQNALERLAVPPGRRIARVGGHQLGLETQTLQVFGDPRQASGLEVQRGECGQARFAFEQVAGLAARRAAGIEHALARSEVEQSCGQLRRFVLHADAAFGEAGQALHVESARQANPVFAERAGKGFDASALQLGKIAVAVGLPTVDPQGHRRVGIVGRADGFPLLGPVRLQAFLQPARMRQADHRVALKLAEQRLPFTLGTAQHGIEQALGPGLLQLVDAAYRFADRRVRRDAGV